MKDEHDSKTAELPATVVDLAVAREKSVTSNEKNKAVLFTTDTFKRAELRSRQGMESWLPVSMVAKDWSVSARRIRNLLEAQRLEGRQKDNGYWEVRFPYRMEAGTRGPALRREVNKVERMQERKKCAV